jgi:hypothetical protein
MECKINWLIDWLIKAGFPSETITELNPEPVFTGVIAWCHLWQQSKYVTRGIIKSGEIRWPY